jgi:DNA invertase Pin-like site-specific DNA recombinase
MNQLGRNMFEVINLINQLSERGVQLIFVRQPQLSTAGAHGKLLLASTATSPRPSGSLSRCAPNKG